MAALSCDTPTVWLLSLWRHYNVAFSTSASTSDVAADRRLTHDLDFAVGGRERVEVLGAEVQHVGRFVNQQVLHEVRQQSA